ncbi:MAG TPA: 16S rRNA (uracil(1498)-N(3))-methyltransferase, partial [Woeseiaceae bacterium]|nr:16S rRNA (uracil(1498)-N(3))-methyltransferase [Woeseiaceae bacterium]
PKPPNRLYVPEALRPGHELRLDDERAHYVARVLRLRVGDGLVLFDGSGGEFAAAIAEVSKRGIVVRIGERREQNVESPLPIALIQGISRGERMDFVVQKATELGVHRITPLVTEFSVVRLDGGRSGKRREHWSRIAASACEQCGRNVVPAIDAPQSFSGWLESGASSAVARILLHPGAKGTLAGLERIHDRVELLIGPEGGLSDSEVMQAEAAGFSACSLGPRILRTETAALAAIAVLQARWGDFR